ncbi:MAG: hypothetical protein OEW05_11260 [Candidatus Aminicenantes bacterium]|nr:hypothetical protein [Candidatus Aminicenantes bacterium]
MLGKKTGLSKEMAVALTLVFWAAAAWCLYPLLHLEEVDMSNVKPYLYRSAMGITILLIFYGKTLYDLIFPWVLNRTIPRLNAVLLTLYLAVLTGGIVFFMVRAVVLYLKSRQRRGFIF